MRRALAAALVMALAGCVRPAITVCGQPGACVINVCTTGNTCTVKPIDLKGLP